MAPVTFGCVGDVHEAFGHLGSALRWLARHDVDAVLLTGDFTRGLPPRPGRPGADPLSPVRRSVLRARATGLPVYFVPGNHDRPEVPLEGNVDRSGTTVEGIRLYGIGGSGPARMGFPYEWADEEIARLEVPDRDLLLTHAPPADTSLDVGGTLCSQQVLGGHVQVAKLSVPLLQS
jgi:Icc-related predicted phosphoesterase